MFDFDDTAILDLIHQRLDVIGPKNHTVIFPGSFNPIHDGHRQMADIAAQWFGEVVCFEVSIANVDKPPLDLPEIKKRLHQFSDSWPVVLSRAPLFSQKATLFPKSTFVIGADTALRLDDPKYYQGAPQQRDAAIDQIKQLGCRFLVFGRVVETQFQDARQLQLSSCLADICDAVPETDFRVDLRSRDLRKPE